MVLQHASQLIFLLLTLITGYHCTHFRGGHISWSVPANSLTVSFTLQAYWNTTYVQNSMLINFGDGISQSVVFPNVGVNSDYTTVGGNFSHTYKTKGNYIVWFSDCCRISDLRGGANAPYRVQTLVSLTNTYSQVPTLSIPAILDFGVGANTFAIVTSFAAKWSFTPIAESSLPYLQSTGIFGNVASPPKIAAATNLPNVAQLTWNAAQADIGLWAVQVKATTTYGSVASDFLIRVRNYSVSANPVTIDVQDNKKFYALTIGDQADFTVTCKSPTSTKFLLLTPAYYPGLTLNGQSDITSVSVQSGVPVKVLFVPSITNGADNQAYMLTFTCRDTNSYYSTTTTVSVTVGKPFVILPPPSATIGCHPSCGCLPPLGTANVSDGCCGTPTISYKDSDSYGSCKTSITRTWYGSNQCGQSGEATQIIFVNDDNPPTFDTTCEDTTVQCFAQLSDVVNTGIPFASDTCTEVTIDFTDSSTYDQSNCNNQITRTFIATDECKNSATYTQKIAVRDTEAPLVVINTEAPLKVDCPSDAGFFDGIIVTIDNCDDEVRLNYTDNPPGVICGKFTRTWIATDVCGNSATYERVLEISHNVPPTLKLPIYSLTPECKDDVEHFGYPTAISHCGTALKVIYNGTTYDVDNNNCYKGATRYFYTVDECGNINTTEQYIKIEDVTAPTLDIPKNYTTECLFGDHCGYSPCDEYYLPKYTGWATAYDNCGPKITPTYQDFPQPNEGCTRIIKRTWTAVDACGNTISKDQYIFIVDTSPPEVCPPTDFDGYCPADVTSIKEPTKISDCHSTTTNYTTTDLNQAYGKCGDYTAIRTWRVTDECGNYVDLPQKIEIRDTIPPKIQIPPDTIVECATKVNPDVTGWATGTDNCGGVTEPTYEDFTYGTDYVSYLLRVWLIKDFCGNSATGNQTIIFNNSKPFLDCPKDVNATCFASSFPNLTGYATASDLCTGTLKPTYVDSVSGTCPQIISRVWSVSDSVTGKSDSCTQTITIGHKGTGPHLKPPRDTSVQCEYLAVTENTGTACASNVCPEDNYTVPVHSDTWEGTKCNPGRRIVRKWSSADQCADETVGTQIVNVWDNQRPVISIPDTCTVTCRFHLSSCCNATASDNCDTDGNPITITHSDSVVPTDILCPITIARLWEAKDCTGNIATGTQTIQVLEKPPVFIGYPPYFLSNTECESCLSIPPLYAEDSCGNKIAATYTLSKSGSCPTLITVTWTATDSCGRSSTFVQTAVVNDITPPTLNTEQLKDVVVECDDEIPDSGYITGRDNCDGVGVPTYKDEVVAPNCTCDSCKKTIRRTWIVTDKCGLVSEPYVQTIIVEKTKPPTIKVPANYTVACGTSYTPDLTGTGAATAEDSCGMQLLATYVDATYTKTDGSVKIHRTWSATDNCGRTTSVPQDISIVAESDKDIFKIPDDKVVPCGADIFDDAHDYPQGAVYNDYGSPVYASSPCGPLTVENQLDEGCPKEPGKYYREWRAIRNGVLIHQKYQVITQLDCPPNGPGITNVPQNPSSLSNNGATGGTIIPYLTVVDLDLPCDILTINWTWGDGTYTVTVCNPDKIGKSPCKFDGKQLITWTEHTYTTPGIWPIKAVVKDQRAVLPPDGNLNDQGDGYVVFRSQFVTVNPYSGSVCGVVDLIAQSGDDYLTSAGKCTKPWIRKGLYYNLGDKYSDLTCAGTVTISFCAQYSIKDDVVSAVGNTSVSWPSCAGLSFTSSKITHLSLFEDGVSALVTGVGKYSVAPLLGDIPFSLYLITPSPKGSPAIHFRLSDGNGEVLMDTDQCQDDINYKIQPQTIPTCNVVPGGGVQITNPARTTVTAVATGTGYGQSGITGGAIAGIVIGIMVFIVLIGIIVFIILKRRRDAEKTAQPTKTYNSYGYL